MEFDVPHGMRLRATAQVRFAAESESESESESGSESKAHLPLPALQEKLMRQLGERPRRLGMFAQLALAGALECRDRLHALEIALPAETAVLLTSEYSVWPELAARMVAFNVRQQAPTPYEFLAVQANSACLAVAQHLNIAGPGLLVSCDGKSASLALAALASDVPAVLLAQVELGKSEWISVWSFYTRDG